MRNRRQSLVVNTTAAPPKPQTAQFNVVTFNIKGPKIRTETLEGVEYTVVPMVMLTEGVHSGSQGPILYPAEEIAKTPEVWNHKPIVVYHPERNGLPISACEPEVINARKIGLIMNTRYVEEMDTKTKKKMRKLHAEAWIDEKKTKKVDNRVWDAIEKKTVMELSTGLFLDNEESEGEWNGEKYTRVARNYRADHLAILPDQTGACSIADGAGFIRNEVSFQQVRDLLHAALREEYPEQYCYVEDVFTKFFVYMKNGVFYKQSYTATDVKASLVGEPVVVVRVVQYRLTDGTVVANIEKETTSMDRQKMIENLVSNSNGVWGEGDREWLNAQTDARLKQLTANLKAETEADKPTESKPKTDTTPAATPAPVGNTTLASTPVHAPKTVSVNDYVANAPPEIRDMLATGLRAHAAEKAKLVSQITANAKNKFTAEQLNAKDLSELQAIAALAVNEQRPANPTTYAGLADAFSANTAGGTGEIKPLPLPSLSFEKQK